jgi:hypothetical protein
VADLNLIHLFDFYLGAAFLVSLTLRFNQYRSILALVRAVPERWPKLFRLVKGHSTIFLTAGTILPGACALTLYLIHTLACRLVWPRAAVTVGYLGLHVGAVPIVAVLGAVMLGVDTYVTLNFGRLDRDVMQKYFDQAEYWLRSWTAPVVKIVTFGYVNPRERVATEVQKALRTVNRLLNLTLWWFSLQIGCRVAFGLSLWLTYALSGPGL